MIASIVMSVLAFVIMAASMWQLQRGQRAREAELRGRVVGVAPVPVDVSLAEVWAVASDEPLGAARLTDMALRGVVRLAVAPAKGRIAAVTSTVMTGAPQSPAEHAWLAATHRKGRVAKLGDDGPTASLGGAPAELARLRRRGVPSVTIAGLVVAAVMSVAGGALALASDSQFAQFWALGTACMTLPALVLIPRMRTTLTAEGEALLQRVVPAQRWLADAAAGRTPMPPLAEAERLLPWAMLAGEGDAWAHKLEAMHRAAGSRPAWLEWDPAIGEPIRTYVAAARSLAS